MNDLIVAPTPDAGLGEFYETLGIIGPVANIAGSIQDGSAFGALSGALSLVTDVAATLVDPIAALGSSVANLLLTYMPPLPQYLDALVGNPGAVEGMASTWVNIAQRIGELRDDIVQTTGETLEDWTGPAATAYQSMVDVFAQVMDGVRQAGDAIATGLQLASAIISLVQTIVKQLVSDLVGQLISAVVETLATAGAGAVVAVPQCVIKIAKYAMKAKEWVEALTTSIRGFVTFVDNINNIMNRVVPGLATAGEKLTIITVSNVIADGVESYPDFQAVGQR